MTSFSYELAEASARGDPPGDRKDTWGLGEKHPGGTGQVPGNWQGQQQAFHFSKAAQPGALEMFNVLVHFQLPQINNIGAHTDA